MVALWSLTEDRTTLRSAGRPDRTYPTPAVPPVNDAVTRISGAASLTAAPAAFTHPGVLHGPNQLAYTTAQLLLGGSNPSKDGWTKMLAAVCSLPNSVNNARLYSSLSWVPNPWAYVGRGPDGSPPSEGDQDEEADAIAAYCHALIWAYTGTRASAAKSVEILNAWGSTLQDHKFDLTTYAGGLLQAARVGSMWPRAAEIMRHTYTPTGAETPFDAAGFGAMLTRAILPRVRDGWTGGGANWLMTMADAHLACATYLDSQDEFNLGLTHFLAWLPSVIWMTGDVNPWPLLAGLPIAPAGTIYDTGFQTRGGFNAYWQTPTTDPPWIDGLEGETGRDPQHMAAGLAAIGNVCETARIQGVDLYGLGQARITTGYELNAGFMHQAFVSANVTPTGWPYTNGINITQPTASQRCTWRHVYNHYATRKGISMPNTLALITDYVASTPYVATGHIAFEGLTFPGTP